jgi:thymidylate synthase
MNKSNDFADVQYAVIEALQTEAGAERFVIAYHNERSLHDVIAAPCILASGFSSREEAVATTEAWGWVAA